MRGGQVPVRGTFQPEISSRTAGGQVPVKQRTDGDRGGDLASRGYVSPLGGATAPYSTNNQQGQERKERP